MPEYYHDLITEKSWKILQDLRRSYQFVLIGGWAVYLYTHALKSKDVDCIVTYDVLEKLRASYTLTKNDRLKKYEIKIGEIDVDIYVPHYSNPGLPPEVIQQHTAEREGFTVPYPTILLLLKQFAHGNRQGTPKGEKDKLDILSLLKNASIDWERYHVLVLEHGRHDYHAKLRHLLQSAVQAPELGLNEHAMSKLRKSVLPYLG